MHRQKTSSRLGAVLAFSVVFAATTVCAQEDCRGLSLELARLGYVPNRIIVKPRNLASFESLTADELLDFTGQPLTVRQVGDTGAFIVDSPDATTAELLEGFGRKIDLFEYIEKDVAFVGHALPPPKIPNDPEFTQSISLMWGLRALHPAEAWGYGQGSDGIVAAVVDSGIQKDHTDLIDNVFLVGPSGLEVKIGPLRIRCQAGDFGYDAIDGDCRPQKRSPHGTQVSGVLGARGNNKEMIVGVNWIVRIMPVTFLDENNVGCASRAANALAFVHRAKHEGVNVRVANLSWGGHQHSRLIEHELIKLAAAKIVIVASAGNEGANIDQHPVYPAGYTNIHTLIAVAGTEQGGGMAPLSNYGNVSVHIAAPGARIRTTDPEIEVDDVTGTSVAAPFVSGTVALIASQCPDLTARALKSLILDNAALKGSLERYVVKGRFLDLDKAARACADLKRQPQDAGQGH